ncbi:MAG: hypothetical protein NT062_15945 [Proteobacteria bacterium]|nr:hypothetical protein [Pseudomonadota bacterium]
MIDERVRELESLYQTLAKANAVLAEADSFERWGRTGASAAEVARQDEAAREAEAVAAKVTRELHERIATLRERAPDVIVRWAEVRVQLLDELLAHQPALRTVVSLEKEPWLQFARGEGPFPVPWPGSGVTVDPVRRVQLLGG